MSDIDNGHRGIRDAPLFVPDVGFANHALVDAFEGRVQVEGHSEAGRSISLGFYNQLIFRAV